MDNITVTREGYVRGSFSRGPLMEPIRIVRVVGAGLHARSSGCRTDGEQHDCGNQRPR